MSELTRSNSKSDHRVVSLRARRDLTVIESVFQGERCWVVKDPVRMKYFRIREPEYLVLQMLDRTHSYEKIRQELQWRFPEQTFSTRNVQSLVNSFHKSGLLLSDAPGQSIPLKKEYAQEQKQKLLQLISSIVAIRFPGVDPERFLNWLYPKTKWFFNAKCTIVNFLIVAAAILLVTTNADEFMRRMPEFQQFFGLNNLLFMGGILIVTKSIHELGHGLMCKHFGGECHEIGFMLLVLTPAMYCNTSDSWILPNKWKRMAIGAAGMYVEVVLAAICTFIWWYSNPGFLHYLCLNVMFLSGVSTILFNANPLLRYDGYFILSDYLEIPNLSNKAKLSLINRARVLCLGMEPLGDRTLPQRKQLSFALYSVASFIYRWFIMLVIFWFLHEVFEPYGLQAIGHTVIAVSLIGMIVVPLFKLLKFFWHPGRLREVKRIPTMTSASIVALLAIAFFFVELPHSVWVNFVVRPAGAQYVYVNQSGAVDRVLVQPGSRVAKGDRIAVLKNPDLEIELAKLEGELASHKADLATYRMLDKQKLSLESARKASQAQTEIAVKLRLIDKLKQQVDDLVLTADRDGFVIPPPNEPQEMEQDITLASWSGSPMDRLNRAAYLERETLFCMVGDPAELKAVLLVDQSDVKLLKESQAVQLVLNQYRSRRLYGAVTEISRDELDRLPRELSKTNGGPVAGTPLPSGYEKPLLKVYEATVPLETSDIKLVPGMFGTARIEVGTSTLANRTWRFLQTVINFR